jgi:hypothetical protein
LVAWVLGYGTVRSISWPEWSPSRGAKTHQLWVFDGEICLEASRNFADLRLSPGQRAKSVETSQWISWLPLGYFYAFDRVRDDGVLLSHHWRLWMICPFACFYAAILPAGWGLLHLASRRTKRIGLCPKCSYDLRAHKPGDKCPECGTVITQAQHATKS